MVSERASVKDMTNKGQRNWVGPTGVAIALTVVGTLYLVSGGLAESGLDVIPRSLFGTANDGNYEVRVRCEGTGNVRIRMDADSPAIARDAAMAAHPDCQFVDVWYRSTSLTPRVATQ